MRQIGVISDVHGNLEALVAVLRQLRGKDVYCLGDVVDYGSNPNEVIEMLVESKVKTILGNHDHAALTGETALFNPRAAMASIWTARMLTQESRRFLEGLPDELTLRIEDVEAYFTHGSPDDKLWEYVDPRTHSDLLGHYLDVRGVQVIGLGHTHVPYVWKEENGLVFNPGSVGQPRDGDRRAAFVVLKVEGDNAEVEFKRVDYEYEKAASRIREAGLPEYFAERLLTGT
jgi:putative phosphoesterase